MPLLKILIPITQSARSNVYDAHLEDVVGYDVVQEAAEMLMAVFSMVAEEVVVVEATNQMCLVRE